MIDCATIRDLLPLYVDDVLSRESKALVSGHLASCEECKELFGKMQSEFVKLPPNDGAKFDALKSMNRKINRQKAVAAIIAGVVALVIAFAGAWFIFVRSIPAEYRQGIVRAEKSTVTMDWNKDGTATTATVLSLISDIEYNSIYSSGRIVSINGIETEVVYVYLRETLFTRWFPRADSGGAFQLLGVGENMTFSTDHVNYPSLPLEVYYMVFPYDEYNTMSDEDFYAQRNKGVLLWRGVVDGE